MADFLKIYKVLRTVVATRYPICYILRDGAMECKNGFTYHPRGRFLDLPCGEFDDFVNTLRHIVKTVKTIQKRQKQGEWQ